MTTRHKRLPLPPYCYGACDICHDRQCTFIVGLLSRQKATVDFRCEGCVPDDSTEVGDNKQLFPELQEAY